jgi:hypothetical protein
MMRAGRPRNIAFEELCCQLADGAESTPLGMLEHVLSLAAKTPTGTKARRPAFEVRFRTFTANSATSGFSGLSQSGFFVSSTSAAEGTCAFTSSSRTLFRPTSSLSRSCTRWRIASSPVSVTVRLASRLPSAESVKVATWRICDSLPAEGVFESRSRLRCPAISRALRFHPSQRSAPSVPSTSRIPKRFGRHSDRRAKSTQCVIPRQTRKGYASSAVPYLNS